MDGPSSKGEVGTRNTPPNALIGRANRGFKSRRPGNLLEWCRQARQADFLGHRLSQQLGVTQRTIQSWWKDMEGPPLEAWLLEQRLGVAVPLLELFGSVKEAAALAGYSDPTVFGRLFKRCHGLTPGEYLAAFQARSPWWSDKEMRSSLLAMQNDCRAELGRKVLKSKPGSLVGKT